VTIDRITIYTADIEKLSDFYENYFYAIRGDDSADEHKGTLSVYLKFDGDAVLELVEVKSSGGGARAEQRIGRGSFCIAAGSRKSVDSVSARVFREGYRVVEVPHATGSGSYEGLIEDPDGNLVRVTG